MTPLIREMLYGPSGQLVIYGEAHPRQLVWVRNGESVKRALARRIHSEHPPMPPCDHDECGKTKCRKTPRRK